MSIKTARQYIEKIAKAGIFREVAGNARNQTYRVDEIFGAMDTIQE